MKRIWGNPRGFRDRSILPSPSGKLCQGPVEGYCHFLSGPCFASQSSRARLLTSSRFSLGCSCRVLSHASRPARRVSSRSLRDDGFAWGLRPEPPVNVAEASSSPKCRFGNGGGG